MLCKKLVNQSTAYLKTQIMPKRENVDKSENIYPNY